MIAELGALLMASSGDLQLSLLEDMPLPITVTTDTIEELRKREHVARREWAPKCRMVWSKRNDLDTVFADPTFKGNISRLAEHIGHGDHGCRKDLALALALMERTAGVIPLLADRNDVLQLIALHDDAKTPESGRRAIELKRMLWVRGLFYGNEAELGWSEAERLAFVAREDVWAQLNDQKPPAHWAVSKIAMGLLNPASPRYDAAKGVAFVENWSKEQLDVYYVTWAARLLIEGQGVASDLPRAEALLWKAAPYDDQPCAMILPLIMPRLESRDASVREAAVASLLQLLREETFGRTPSGCTNPIRTALVPHVAARLGSKDSAAAADSVAQLTEFVVVGNDAATAPLLRWLDRKLTKGGIEEKRLSWQSLARLVRFGSPEGLKLLDTDIERTGGVANLGLLKQDFITSDDYPSAALRNGEEGVVSLTVIFAPDGRGVQASVTKGASSTLDAAVVGLAIRRLRNPKFADHPGRYVRARLPDIQFRLLGCDKGEAVMPAIPGAVLVDSKLCIDRYIAAHLSGQRMTASSFCRDDRPLVLA